MVDKAKRAAAIKLFEGFTGDDAINATALDIPADDVLVQVGECEAIAYTATRDGETHSYQHEFKPHARPILCVSHDGARLYLLAGSYKFTHRGIEDN